MAAKPKATACGPERCRWAARAMARILGKGKAAEDEIMRAVMAADGKRLAGRKGGR